MIVYSIPPTVFNVVSPNPVPLFIWFLSLCIMTRERISCTFDQRDMSSFRIAFSFVNAAVSCAYPHHFKTASLVVSTIKGNSFVYFFDCTMVSRASDVEKHQPKSSIIIVTKRLAPDTRSRTLFGPIVVKLILVSSTPEFRYCYFCNSSCLFHLSFNFDFYLSKMLLF